MLYLRGTPGDLGRGLTRRDFIRVGFGAGLGGLGGLGLLAAGLGSERPAARQRHSFGRAKSCIVVYLFGGPSHIDIWDLKPAAPAEIRGEFKPGPTNVPGVQIVDLLPRLARQMDQWAVIRSLTHGDNSHGSASHTMLTGHRPRALGEVPPTVDDFPHYGAVLSRLKPPPPGVTPFVSLPWSIMTSTNVVPGQNGGFLGRAMDPFRLEPPEDQTPIFTPPLTNLPPDVPFDRVRGRQVLQGRVGDVLHGDDNARQMDKLYERAFHLLLSANASRAFQLEREPPKVRERYGLNVFGQSLLLARRLVEAGVPAVNVFWPDRKEPEAYINNGVKDNVGVPAWDTHGNKVGNTPNFPALRDRLLPPLDLGTTALIEDLQARGLLEQTLVVVTGEFGRTPRINPDAGRDHYGNVFSSMLAGGGIQGGQVYGASDKHAAFPADNPVTPAQFAATLYHCLGVPPDAAVPDRLGRPVHVIEAEPLPALLA